MSEAPPPAQRARTPRALWVLYTDTFTMAVGFYMLVPLLAVHFLDGLGLTIALVGLLSAIRSASQNGMMPIAGWIADRVDYRRAISIGVLIRALGFALLGTAQSTPALVAASILTGLGGALFHPASYAAYAALAQGQNRVRVYATREMVSNLGFVVGPVVGGLLAGLNFSYVSWSSAGLFVLAFLVTVIGLPGGLSGPRQDHVRMRSRLRRPGVPAVLRAGRLALAARVPALPRGAGAGPRRAARAPPGSAWSTPPPRCSWWRR